MAANGSSPDLFGSGDESDKGGGSPNSNPDEEDRPNVACAGAAGSSGAGAGVVAAGPSGAGAGAAGPSGAGAGAAGPSGAGAGAGPYGDVSNDSESDDSDAHPTPPVLTNKIMRGKGESHAL